MRRLTNIPAATATRSPIQGAMGVIGSRRTVTEAAAKAPIIMMPSRAILTMPDRSLRGRPGPR